MIEITENTFNQLYTEFLSVIGINNGEKLISFKHHPFIDLHENYKYAVLEQAKERLFTANWKEPEIGKGKILKAAKDSILTNVIYNFKREDNNLIDWRKKDDFNKLEANYENEKLFFDFFKSKVKDEIAFNKFIQIGFSYQLIAYLFFIKNSQKYAPISQERFDAIFASLNIDFKTSNNCSWKNYLQYSEILNSFKKYLSKLHKDITLLDTHSFLFIYGYKFGNQKQQITPKSKPIFEKIDLQINEITKPEQPSYQPKTIIDLEKYKEVLSEIDYLAVYQKLKEIGDLAEEFVLEAEITFLKNIYPELSAKVRSVANDSKLGFDILSYETDGKQKQIEVKAISVKNDIKSFIITRNEIEKSKIYPNYYLYGVTELNTATPKIIRIKNPDFEDETLFLKEPLTYKITFE